MSDALLASLTAGASAADVNAAYPLAVSALASGALAKPLLGALIDVATSEPEAGEAAGAALMIAFALTVSANGTEVARYDEAPLSESPPVGVLVLGFGGASTRASSLKMAPIKHGHFSIEHGPSLI